MLINDFGLSEKEAKSTIDLLEANAEEEPLVMLQPIDGGQYMLSRMQPNFEMSLFIAQVTGSIIVTDSESRWIELQRAQHRNQGVVNYPWDEIYAPLNLIPIDYESLDTFNRSSGGEFLQARQLLKSADDLVRTDDSDVIKVARLGRQAIDLINQLTAKDAYISEIKMLSPERGFYDRTVQRLLIRSGCQRYDSQVRSVYFVGGNL